jgi:hypothetical protein
VPPRRAVRDLPSARRPEVSTKDEGACRRIRPRKLSVRGLIMSLGFPGFRSGAGGPGRILPMMCEHCGTDRHLVIRAVSDLPDHPADIVLASYTCGRCGLFSEHPALVADLSMVLGRREQAGDLLILGCHYLHCGEPMKKTGSELRRLSASVSRDSAPGDRRDVYLSTRVLKCRCGFRLEVPE